jgi:molybdopterin-guanine dinucleotide biosynthesis protein
MRGFRRTAAGAAAIALSIGVLAGCGSSDSGATTAAEATTAVALTKAGYVAKVNAICTKIDDTASAIGNQNADSIRQAKAGIAELTANAKAGIASLKALTPPADLQAAHDSLVASSSEAIALNEKIVAGVEAGTVDKAQLTADATEAEALAKTQAVAVRDLGLSNCFTGDEPGDTNDPDDAG